MDIPTITVTFDGEHWCAEYAEVIGFGKTPDEAVRNLIIHGLEMLIEDFDADNVMKIVYNTLKKENQNA